MLYHAGMISAALRIQAACCVCRLPASRTRARSLWSTRPADGPSARFENCGPISQTFPFGLGLSISGVPYLLLPGLHRTYCCGLLRQVVSAKPEWCWN